MSEGYEVPLSYRGDRLTCIYMRLFFCLLPSRIFCTSDYTFRGSHRRKAATVSILYEVVDFLHRMHIYLQSLVNFQSRYELIVYVYYQARVWRMGGLTRDGTDGPVPRDFSGANEDREINHVSLFG